MDTRILGTTQEDIREAARILMNKGLVAFPTETVYGLGANALCEEAVAKVYQAKGRPSDNPMIVHIACMEQFCKLTYDITEDMKKLADTFWPGPLTMVVPARDEVPRITTGGLDTVAVRMPDNKTTLTLIAETGEPLAGPSANLSGHPSPTTAAHVDDDLHDKIDAIIQGEDCRVGIESTVVDMTEKTPVILRPGVITGDQISKALGREVKIDPAVFERPDSNGKKIQKRGAGSLLVADEDFKPRSPGMKYKHYAPKAEMIIFRGEPEKVRLAIAEEKMFRIQCGQKVGIIMYDDNDPKEAAHDFFAKLRAFDKSGVDVIIAAALKEDGVGLAVMNRMLKSAGYNIREI